MRGLFCGCDRQSFRKKLLLAATLGVAACHGAQYTDEGIVFTPAPEGDATEVSIETLLRDATGIYMGMRRGVAIEEIQERSDAEYSSQPTSGGITSMRLVKGVYFALYSYTEAHDVSSILVCGYSFRVSGSASLPLIPTAEIRSRLLADSRTLQVGNRLYRKTPLRAISLYENAFFYVDRTQCAARDPGPPEPAR